MLSGKGKLRLKLVVERTQAVFRDPVIPAIMHEGKRMLEAKSLLFL